MSTLDDVHSLVTKINALDLTEGECRALAILCGLRPGDDEVEGFAAKPPKDDNKAAKGKRPAPVVLQGFDLRERLALLDEFEQTM